LGAVKEECSRGLLTSGVRAKDRAGAAERGLAAALPLGGCRGRRFLDGGRDLLHALEVAGLVAVNLLREPQCFLLDGSFPVIGVGVV